jgi:hypothetical protein
VQSNIWSKVFNLLYSEDMEYENHIFPDGRGKMTFKMLWLEEVDPLTNQIIHILDSSPEKYVFIRQGEDIDDIEIVGDLEDLKVDVKLTVELV